MQCGQKAGKFPRKAYNYLEHGRHPQVKIGFECFSFYLRNPQCSNQSTIDLEQRMRLEKKLLTVPGLLVLVALIAVVMPGLSQTSHARPADQEATAPLGKIAPWVMEHTAGGGQVEFLIVLADQADLSGAEALPTKLEKGRYVRDALWSKAQSTQAPLLAQLAARHIEHRSYYIVNLIWVKGDRDLALDLAARPDVARIEANPQISNTKYQISNLQSPIERDGAKHRLRARTGCVDARLYGPGHRRGRTRYRLRLESPGAQASLSRLERRDHNPR